MRRLPLVLSATALVVAVFGSTPVGHAVGSAIPAFAKSAGYAKQAGNASALNGIKASKQPRPGALLPLGADGKFPVDRSGSSGQLALPGRRATGGTGVIPVRSDPRGPRAHRSRRRTRPRRSGRAERRQWLVSTSSPKGKAIPLRRCPQDVWTSTARVAKKRSAAVWRCLPALPMRVVQSAPSGAAATGLGRRPWRTTPVGFRHPLYVWAICASVS